MSEYTIYEVAVKMGGNKAEVAMAETCAMRLSPIRSASPISPLLPPYSGEVLRNDARLHRSFDRL
jgi:hypothetical protein